MFMVYGFNFPTYTNSTFSLSTHFSSSPVLRPKEAPKGLIEGLNLPLTCPERTPSVIEEEVEGPSLPVALSKGICHPMFNKTFLANSFALWISFSSGCVFTSSMYLFHSSSSVTITWWIKFAISGMGAPWQWKYPRNSMFFS